MDDETVGPMGQLSAHLDRGWDLVAKGDFAGATLSAQESLEVDEASPEAHHLLGYIYQAEGRAEDALEQYRMALELDEGFIDAMLHAADVLVHPLGELQEALELVREALDWLGEDEIDLRADAMLLEVDIHLLRQDEEAARKVVRELPEGPFENPAIGLQVGRARFDVGDVEGAEPLILAAAEATPHDADAQYYSALLHDAKDAQSLATLAFLSSRELDLATPTPPWALPPKQFEGRVRAALEHLGPALTKPIEGALVVVTDLPGAEVVSEGVDPRQPVLLDDLSNPEGPPRVGRIFIYKRNIERVAAGLFQLDVEIARAIEAELLATFASLDKAAEAEDSASGEPDGGARDEEE